MPAILFSGIAGYLWNQYGMPGMPSDASSQMVAAAAIGVLAQISATMLGFMMAVLAILASISNSLLVRNMQRSGHFHAMLVRIFVDNLGFAAVTVISFVIAFRPDWMTVLAPFVFGFLIFSSALFASSLVMLWQTLAHLKPTNTQTE